MILLNQKLMKAKINNPSPQNFQILKLYPLFHYSYKKNLDL